MAARTKAITALDKALAKIEKANREPDEWERTCLSGGINALVCGAYALATTEAKLAMMPKSKRRDFVPNPRSWDMRMLRKSFDAGRAQPVQPYAHMGPAIIESGASRDRS